MELIIGYIGFIISAYSVIANDVIQILGTFISSNFNVKWCWPLFFAISGRQDHKLFPENLEWWYLSSPIALLDVRTVERLIFLKHEF